MKLEQLQKEMIAAMKAKDKARKDAISNLVAAVKMAGINSGNRDEIPEDMVNSVIIKEAKLVKEQIDSCPEARQDLKTEYEYKFSVYSEFIPKQMDEDEIKAFINEKFADVLATKNKGQIMKTVMPELKGKADGKLINKVIGELC